MDELEYDRAFQVEAARVAYPALLAHMDYDAPNEAVGLLWDDGTTTRLTNQARSPSRFSVGRTQMAEALADVDPTEKILIGLYHSHPNGMIRPSLTDEMQMCEQAHMEITLPWLIVTPDHSLHIWWWEMGEGKVSGYQIHRYSLVV